MSNTEKLFYAHFLMTEKRRRNEAIKLFNKKEFSLLMQNYTHYYRSEWAIVRINSSLIDDVIKRLEEIKTNLPSNAHNIYIDVIHEYILCVRYSKITILGKKQCEGIARHIAKSYQWKMKHQPNGKDGKKSLLLYNKLIAKT